METIFHYERKVSYMIEKLYEKTKGYKTLTGFVCAFVTGGLLYTGVIDQKQAEMLGVLVTAMISFGLGDRVGRNMQ